MSDVVVGVQGSVGQGRLARFRSSAVYDALMRAPLIAWFLLCAVATSQRLLQQLGAAPQFGFAQALEALAGLAGLGFILLVSGALFVRLRPIARAPGLATRVAAIGGTFSITALGLFPRADLPLAATAASVLLICGGYALACYALAHLGRSLSIMAEARRLVTTGPYALMRHPLYAGEALASCGLLLQFLSPAAVALWTAHIGLQLFRMQCEERLLRDAFPEYGRRFAGVARVLPGIY